ncbi:MAG: hypothetical protein AAB562_03245 [Patescibacteria group bacterium]
MGMQTLAEQEKLLRMINGAEWRKVFEDVQKLNPATGVESVCRVMPEDIARVLAAGLDYGQDFTTHVGVFKLKDGRYAFLWHSDEIVIDYDGPNGDVPQTRLAGRIVFAHTLEDLIDAVGAEKRFRQGELSLKVSCI